MVGNLPAGQALEVAQPDEAEPHEDGEGELGGGDLRGSAGQRVERRTRELVTCSWKKNTTYGVERARERGRVEKSGRDGEWREEGRKAGREERRRDG